MLRLNWQKKAANFIETTKKRHNCLVTALRSAAVGNFSKSSVVSER